METTRSQSPEVNGRDCRTDPRNNPQPCKHCNYHIQEILANGAPAEGREHLEYPENTYPVVFNCQFLYQNEAVEIQEYCSGMYQKFCEAIRKEFGQNTPVYEHMRIYKGESVWHDDQAWTCWFSFLVDLPRLTKINGALKTKLGLDEIAPKGTWMIKTHLDGSLGEDWRFARIHWFMKNAGISHQDAICNESFIGYLGRAKGSRSAFAQLELAENMQDYGH